MLRLGLRYLALAAAVLVINFLLPRLLAGDPLTSTESDGLAGATSVLTAQQRADLRATYHLDQPLPAQLASYLLDLARGDLGWSISRAAPVSSLLAERIPWTVALVGTSLVVAACIGVALGFVAAWRRGLSDTLIVTGATGLAALPEFLIAMLLLLTLAVGFGWFPMSGAETAFSADSGPAVMLDRARHLALPAATLALANTAAFALLARGATNEVLAAPYLATARAKGLRTWQVALQHAAPNAVLPVLTFLGLRIGALFAGAVVVERVFAIPGLGLFTFQAIQSRDYPVLQAAFLVASCAVLLANFTTEIAYRVLEPRHAR